MRTERALAIVVAVAATAVGISCRSRGAGDVGEGNAAPSAASGASSGPAVVIAGEGGVLLSHPIVRDPGDAGPMARGIPVPLAKVEAAVNPAHIKPYDGPKGTIEGTVKVSGDPPPKLDLAIPFACGEAYGTYARAFREGTGRTLGDVLIAVTGYEGYVPADGEVSAVKIHGCAYERRTVALTYGQHIEVTNTDLRESFVPTLLGADLPAQLVAVPHGDAVKLYPQEVGHYALADGMKRTWMFADVFVLRYATHAVTGIDGHFRINGVPAGKVKVSAYSPQIDADLHSDVGISQASVDREVELKDGETAQVDFVIPYRAPKPKPKAKGEPERAVVK